MNEHALAVLEYDKVRSIVAAYAASEPGKSRLSLLYPASDEASIQTLLSETREFMRLLDSGEKPPLESIHNIAHVITKLRASGAALSPAELLAAAITLGTGRRVRTFFQRIEAKSGEAPLLCGMAALIRPLREVEDAVFAAVDDRSEIRDSASPGLRKIRKQIARTRDDILSRMSGILQESGFQKVVQEPVITIRDDRYVLPLRPNFRQSIQGVVHGHSGSRATLFVEPLDVLEQNNRLAELRMEEQEEVERILRELTLLLHGELESIEATISALTEIDAVHARARFGLEFRAVVPALSHQRSIRLINARHPLLVGKARASEAADIVPNDIIIDREQRTMVLSGPNAGGKTVILKTVGLLCLMAQSGLPVTAAEGSSLPCFGSIFADIGDEQSLEQDLSTFSSHAGRIAEILREAGRDSLVLLDELGSGTDPGEGAGLGAAVLESLIDRGCVTIVTTHHNALKLFGSETNGAVNAAMEFDPNTLKPTYRLIPGRPGRSYGLDMAARTGIPDDVIAKARSRISSDDVSLDQLLRQVEKDSVLLSSARESLERELASAKRDRMDAEAALRNARDEAREMRAKARAETREIVSALRRKVNELAGMAAPAPLEVRRERAEIEALSKKLGAGQRTEAEAPAAGRHFQPGDRVRIAGVNKTGIVLASGRNLIELELDGKKIKIRSSDVEPVKAGPGPRPPLLSGWGAELDEEESSVTGRLNIIGFRAAEALAEVERLLDRATLHRLSSVTIIHGLGTGALKTAVTDLLRKHPLVASIRTGEPSEGGAGVTIAKLKE